MNRINILRRYWGRFCVFDFLKNEVRYVVERSGLIRCEAGWLVKAVV